MTSAITTIEVAAPERYTFLDLTEELERAIKDSGVTDGSVVAFCAHTTCALIVNEWEDGALEDFRARMLRLVPDDVYYAHDDAARQQPVWRNQRLVVELDGWEFHRTRAAFERDRNRALTLTRAGFQVLPLTQRQLEWTQADVAATLRERLHLP